MAAITIRRATEAPADIHHVARLITAMDLHYLGPDRPRPEAEARCMVEHALASREGTRFALAFDGAEAVGLACYAALRPGHRLGGLLYLKDLFVPAEQRGRGIGTRLLAFLAEEALREGLGRIDFTTDGGNEAAQSLYRRLGAVPQDKVYWRFDTATLPALAAAGGGPESKD
jgi:GNAT superfamily N-acetyltransferase